MEATHHNPLRRDRRIDKWGQWIDGCFVFEPTSDSESDSGDSDGGDEELPTPPPEKKQKAEAVPPPVVVVATGTPVSSLTQLANTTAKAAASAAAESGCEVCVETDGTTVKATAKPPPAKPVAAVSKALSSDEASLTGESDDSEEAPNPEAGAALAELLAFKASQIPKGKKKRPNRSKAQQAKARAEYSANRAEADVLRCTTWDEKRTYYNTKVRYTEPVPVRRTMARRTTPPVAPDKPTLLSFASGFPLTRARKLTRVPSHNLHFDAVSDGCVDLVALIVHATVFAPGDAERVDWSGYAHCHRLGTTFRAAADAALDALLARLRAALVAVRTDFEAYCLAHLSVEDDGLSPPGGWPSRQRALARTLARYRRGVSVAFEAYETLVRRVVPSEPVATRLARDFWGTAQWTERDELVAWCRQRCVTCRGRHDGLMKGPCVHTADWSLWQTACHTGSQTCCPVSGWGHRRGRRSSPLDRQFDAVARDESVELCTFSFPTTLRIWMRPVVGIPLECTLQARCGLSVERIAELGEAAEAEERERAAERTAKRIVKRERDVDYLTWWASGYLHDEAPRLTLEEVFAFEDELGLPKSIPRRPLPPLRALGPLSSSRMFCMQGTFEENVAELVERDPALAGVARSEVLERAARIVHELTPVGVDLTLESVLEFERMADWLTHPTLPTQRRVAPNRIEPALAAFRVSVESAVHHAEHRSVYRWDYDARFKRVWRRARV